MCAQRIFCGRARRILPWALNKQKRVQDGLFFSFFFGYEILDESNEFFNLEGVNIK